MGRTGGSEELGELGKNMEMVEKNTCIVTTGELDLKNEINVKEGKTR